MNFFLFQTYIKAKESSLFLGAHKISTIGLDTELTDESLFVVHKNADQSVSFQTIYGTYLSISKEGRVFQSNIDNSWKEITLEPL